MKIVVTVKNVPDTNAEKTLDPQTKRLNRSAVETVLNPFDEYAIEEALRLREASPDATRVTIATIAPASGLDTLRKALAMGADDAVVLSDDAIAGSDTMATAYLLALLLRHTGFDLVLSGTHSTDALNGIVPAAVAELLGVPCLTFAKKLTLEGDCVEIQRETDDGYARVRAPLPALVSVTKGINEPRYPTLKGIMSAKKKDVRVLSLADVGADPARVGTAGSKTVVASWATAGPRAKGTVITATDPREGARRIFEFLIDRKAL